MKIVGERIVIGPYIIEDGEDGIIWITMKADERITTQLEQDKLERFLGHQFEQS